MRYLHIPLLMLILVMHSAVAAAQEDAADDVALFINYAIDEPTVCSVDQASAFYQTLDGFQQFLDDIGLMDNLEDLSNDWLEEYYEWILENWKPFMDVQCGGTQQLMVMLRAKLKYKLVEEGFGEISEIPADEAMAVARNLAEMDLQVIESSDGSDMALELNRMVADLPRCSAEQALEFYGAIDEYTQMTKDLRPTGALGDIDADELESALFNWLAEFDSWRQEAWSAYYERPCGATQVLLYHLEARTYLAVMLRGAGLDTSPMLTELIQQWRSVEDYDRSLINSGEGE